MHDTMQGIAKTKGQIEDRIAKQVTKYYVNSFGVGPKETRVYIVQDMIIIRLQGKLFPIETKLLENEKGVSLVKDIRKIVHEMTIKNLSDIIHESTQHTVISSHSDISTKTGEIVQIYIIDSNLEDEVAKTKNGG